MRPFSLDGFGRRHAPRKHPRSRRRIEVVIAALLALLSASSLEAAVAADASNIAASGNSAGAPACSACHGQSGEGSPELGYPRLAGLSASYLLQQLNDFASGARESDIMHPIANALSEDERRAMAAFYAATTTNKAAGEKKQNQKVEAVGAYLAGRGLWAKGLPACAQCHGPEGQGVGEIFPRLAGQSADYIEAQLKAWKSGKRNNDPLHLMTGVASKLDDKQIAAVAAYYAGLPPRPAAAKPEGSKP